MTVQIPNTTAPNVAGAPSPASVATESADGSQTPGVADHIQQFSLVNVAAVIKNALNICAQTLGTVFDATLGVLRTRLVSATGVDGTGVTLTGVSTVTTVTTVASLTQVGGVTASTLVTDIMMGTWQDAIKNCVIRS